MGEREKDREMNAPLAGETSKGYYDRQARHWASQAVAALGPDSESEDDLDDKARDRRDKKRMNALKKKAKELSDLAYAAATAAAAAAAATEK